MSTDFSYNNTNTTTIGGFRPNARNTPLDSRTIVNTKADIATIPLPYVGMIITVLADETNEHKMTDYKVKSLKANDLGISNSLIDEVVRYVDYLGVSGEDLSIPTKVSDLENDRGYLTSIPEEYITETELNAKGYLTSHQDISNLQSKTDNSLTTTDKTVVGAINELNNKQQLTEITLTSIEDLSNIEVGEYDATIASSYELIKSGIYHVVKTSDTDIVLTSVDGNILSFNNPPWFPTWRQDPDKCFPQVSKYTLTDLSALDDFGRGYFDAYIKSSLSDGLVDSGIYSVFNPGGSITFTSMSGVVYKYNKTGGAWTLETKSNFVTETELNEAIAGISTGGGNSDCYIKRITIEEGNPTNINTLCASISSKIGTDYQVGDILTGYASLITLNYGNTSKVDSGTLVVYIEDYGHSIVYLYSQNSGAIYSGTLSDLAMWGDLVKVGEADLSSYQTITDNTLTTTDKTVTGAINELKTNVDSITVPTKVSDLENDSNFVTNSKMLEAIANAQLGNGEDSDIDLSVYQPIEESTLTTTAKTIPTAINELKSGLDGIKVPINISELNNDSGYLTEHQDISGLQPKTDDSLTTTDKTIVGAINEISGTQLDTVSFSADYKNIILNRKSGLNPYTIPIASIINNTSLTELKDIDSTDIGNGKTLIYDGATGKHKYVGSTGTDELVKMDFTGDAHYLADLLDKQTIINDNGILKVKKLDGQEVTITEINYLKGLTMNVMDLVSAFANGGVKVINTPLNTASELSTMDRSAFIDSISYIVYVLADENHAGAKTTYLVDKDNTTFFGNADSQRDFTTNPLNLANEVTGKLGTSNIDVDSLWALLTINDTYKTLTVTDNVFGTHGAKAMYDELTTEMGGKANATDLTTHTGDTDIHVTTIDKAKWDKVTDKLDTVDFNTHKDNTDIHITSDERIKLNNIVDKTEVAHIKRFYSVPGNDWNNAIEEGYYSIPFDAQANTIKNRPFDYAIQVQVISSDTNEDNYAYQIAYVSSQDTGIYIRRQRRENDWTSWNRVCTTIVEGVGVTTITPVNSAITGKIEYTVKNGVCYVSLFNVKTTANDDGMSISTTMPKPTINSGSVIVTKGTRGNIGFVYINKGTTQLKADFYITDSLGDCSFSYPVAEY